MPINGKACMNFVVSAGAANKFRRSVFFWGYGRRTSFAARFSFGGMGGERVSPLRFLLGVWAANKFRRSVFF